jgi:hypothetical protein
MKYFFCIFFSLILLLPFLACKKKSEPSPAAKRSFYMGVTPWPADFTVEEVDAAYSFINTYCDMVSHHFDEGIPYEEAYNGSNWPDGLLQDIHNRKIKTATGKKILLSSSVLALSRNAKAPYSTHSVTVSPIIKNQWQSLPFNDAKVVTAYINFMKLLIDSLQPSFINYGVESNVESWDATGFAEYKDFLSKVYQQLKISYPSIPVMVSIMVNETTQSLEYAKQLLPYTDYIALSAYPYTHISSSAAGNTNPALFPSNYFTRYINLDAGKPLCFAETGYIAEPLLVPAFNLDKQGNETWQQAYLLLVCNLVNDNKGKFIVWFCQKDYDAVIIRLKAIGQYQDLFALWTNTGLINENNVQRPAYNTWLDWMNRKLE